MILIAASQATAYAQTVSDPAVSTQPVKSEAARKQKEELLPPKEAAEQADTEIAPDAYQAKGIKAGSFVILPKMEVDLARTNNVYSTNYDGLGDWITTYRPEIAVNSNLNRHEISAYGRVERDIYSHYSRENTTNAFAKLSGRYDLGDTDNISALVTYTHDHEERGSFDDAGGLRPTEYHYLNGQLGGTFVTGRLSHHGGFNAVKRDWEDTRTSTGVTPSHFRNRQEYEVKLRESYELSKGYSWAVEGMYLTRQYQHQRDQAGYQRDSNGIRLSTGLELNISDVIRGDFLVGMMRQDYKDDRLNDPSAPYAKIMLNWSPTKLTTVIPSVERSIEETTAPGVSSMVRTAYNVLVRHELMRNVILSSSVGYSIDEQKGGALTAKTTDAMVRGTYMLNDKLYTSLEMTQKHKLTNIDGAGFNSTVGMLRLGLQY